MNEIVGIVACGGKSTRMESDKSKLIYHELEQRFHVYNLFNGICSEVYISCNSEQSSTIPRDYNFIVDDDEFLNCGPIAALLSYWKNVGNKDILLIGCDYPFLQHQDVENLKRNFLLNNKSTSYYNESTGFYEPLLAVYSYKDYSILLSNHMSGKNSLQNFLNEISASKLIAEDTKRLVSVDNKSEFNKSIKIIKEI